MKTSHLIIIAAIFAIALAMPAMAVKQGNTQHTIQIGIGHTGVQDVQKSTHTLQMIRQSGGVNQAVQTITKSKGVAQKINQRGIDNYADQSAKGKNVGQTVRQVGVGNTAQQTVR